ncbi:hypothetical protein M0812_29113 [Anaeramoeba flamelloides]|uniref:Uncharacterized protein n=1 Tax=Anaeramoeba flamelloides TaxID=1746091 RepID=A0AAV7Y3F4_9EUKA|nr:hypothetical protein M0812_29113 [Anaeramoeba flamelloides]
MLYTSEEEEEIVEELKKQTRIENEMKNKNKKKTKKKNQKENENENENENESESENEKDKRSAINIENRFNLYSTDDSDFELSLSDDELGSTSNKAFKKHWTRESQQTSSSEDY